MNDDIISLCDYRTRRYGILNIRYDPEGAFAITASRCLLKDNWGGIEPQGSWTIDELAKITLKEGERWVAWVVPLLRRAGPQVKIELFNNHFMGERRVTVTDDRCTEEELAALKASNLLKADKLKAEIKAASAKLDEKTKNLLAETAVFIEEAKKSEERLTEQLTQWVITVFVFVVGLLLGSFLRN